MLVVWLGIIVFFFSTGSEIAVGQWSFTLFSEFRDVAVAPAGLWVSIFWGSLTVGRIIFGFITDRIGATRLLRLGMSGMLLGILLYWLNPINQVGFIGLAMIGFCVAPIFPVMIGLSPARFGAKNAPNAIGFQVASAYLGGSLIPALVGVAAVSFGLEVIGPILFAAVVITITVHELLVRKCGV
jgi:fucose permease